MADNGLLVPSLRLSVAPCERAFRDSSRLRGNIMSVFAVVSFCGQESLTLWDRESEAREYLALIGNCSPYCSGLHKIIVLGEVAS